MTYYFQFILKVKIEVRNVNFDPYCAGLLHILCSKFPFVNNFDLQFYDNKR